MDTVDFDPKDCKLFENSIIKCLGYPNITSKEVIKNWRKYDTDLDWTKQNSDSKLIDFAEKQIENSKRLKEECEKHDVKFVDTSNNRDDVLDELLEYITCID